MHQYNGITYGCAAVHFFFFYWTLLPEFSSLLIYLLNNLEQSFQLQVCLLTAPKNRRLFRVGFTCLLNSLSLLYFWCFPSLYSASCYTLLSIHFIFSSMYFRERDLPNFIFFFIYFFIFLFFFTLIFFALLIIFPSIFLILGFRFGVYILALNNMACTVLIQC